MAVDYEQMTDEEYFAAYKIMFNTDGWETMMIELQELAHQVNDVQACKDPDDLKFRQGQLHVLGRILNLEDTVRRAEEDGEVDSIAESIVDI